MDITKQKYVLRFEADCQALTGLMLRSGRAGDFTDSSVEKTSDGRLFVNGYVWASLLRRALSRCTNGQKLAQEWGKYAPDKIEVAPFWSESVFLRERDYMTVVNPGIRINREWGAPESGALYSDELAFPLVPLTFRCRVFFEEKSAAEAAADALCDSLWVISEGIETIGGGWSYGFGRLKPSAARWVILDLKESAERKQLWASKVEGWHGKLDEMDLQRREPEIATGKAWHRFKVWAGITEGQLLAIHTDVPEMGADIQDELPDAFIFTRPTIRENGMLEAIPVVTGKAFRQAVLSREIERLLRTRGKACLNTSDPKREATVPDASGKRRCNCKRCLWFGDADAGGVIAVGDAPVEEGVSQLIRRLQICEHSRQSMNNKFFNGEYLTGGNFTLDVIIDHSRQQDTASLELEKEVRELLGEMLKDSVAPPGWYRLGATTTCTGQIEVRSVTEYPSIL